ncbi:MAG TPA: glycoside hydrolase family 31 protein [Acetobacteraceae bacterium]
MRPIRRAALIAEMPNGVELDCGDGIVCRIALLADDLGRVLFLRERRPRQPRSWMVIAPGEQDTPWEGRDRLDDRAWTPPALVREQGGSLLRTSRLGVRISLDPFRLEWLLPDGRVFLADRVGMPYMFAHRSEALAHYVARNPQDRYYGLGDRTGPLDLHGRRLRTRMTDALGFDPRTGDPMYKHWPFVIARDGATGTHYGLFYDNAAEAAFDLGAEHDNYYGLFRGYEAAGGDLDYYVLPGPRLRDVTPQFLRLTGGTALPPRWTLGYAQTAMAIADAPDAQARMQAFIERCRAEDVPVSSFHMGSGYTSIEGKRYVFNWNRAKFPEPDALMRRFHAAGMKVVANLKPCLLNDHPRYAEVQLARAFVRDAVSGKPLLSQFWDGEGSHIDFTNPAAIAWWQSGLEREVLGVGIDVGWNDNNEYELWDEDAVCEGFGSATPLAMLRPIQSLLMTRTTLEAQRRRAPGERGFTVTRAGCPGIQRYGQTWSGDNSTSWESLRWNLRTGLQMSLSGMYNIGHDIGGFSGPVAEPELLIRWTQAGIVHPRFIMNSWKPDGVYTTPWLHADALHVIRAAIRLRYRLIPYLYSLVHAATAAHEPILRPRFLEFEDDPAAVGDCDELMLGPFLLAAPVVAPGARTRRVYLPAGPEAWFDFYHGTRFAAGADAEVPAPLERLPLLVRAGGIIPMTGEEAGFTRLHDEPSRCLRLFPGPGQGSSRFTLIEDDGLSADGPVARVECVLAWTPEEVTVNVAVSGNYQLPYRAATVELPRSDGRRLVCSSADLQLTERQAADRPPLPR